jgi:hypothetical protein
MAERGYKIIDQQAVHFITFAVVEWIDVFTRSMYADIVIESLNYCVEHKGLQVHAWVIPLFDLFRRASRSTDKKDFQSAVNRK